MPKISIITPVYIDTPEKSDWLDEMIRSVISQTMQDWELIIINDKSPQSIQNIYTNEPRIRWFENSENFGPAMTRNTAVALAQSDCILPLDSDDLLASPEVLEDMYDAWIMDKKKIIYGNLQLYRLNQQGNYERGKIHPTPQYSFEQAMDLRGMFPVTCMHSRECWEHCGGWRSDLKPGLEDVEYWINAGKRGFCGQKINITTFLYRRHETSRAHVLKFGDVTKGIPETFREMQLKIKDIHQDIYRGEFPMACCDKGQATAQASVAVAPAPSSNNLVTRLTGYPENELIWAEYKGPRMGSFDIAVRGNPKLPNGYHILGKGHKFQIHKDQAKFFEDRAKLGFRVRVQEPQEHQTAPVQPTPQPQPPQIIEMPKPEMATILRADKIALDTGSVNIIEPEPENEINEVTPQKAYSLDDLNLSPSITSILENEGYTVDKLAEVSLTKLTSYAGIGIVRGNSIIQKAKELINQT